jgi:hypothetical protein
MRSDRSAPEIDVQAVGTGIDDRTGSGQLRFDEGERMQRFAGVALIADVTDQEYRATPPVEGW